MRPLLRPTLCVLLVMLLTMWGTCPCVYARMLDVDCAGRTSSAHATSAEAGVIPREAATGGCTKACCCKARSAGDTAAGADVPPSPDGDCPCCQRGGCMRDLPPQSQDLVLDTPLLTTFDLPLAVVTDTVLPVARTVAWFDIGPPTCQRPHASPVGIVRLLN